LLPAAPPEPFEPPELPAPPEPPEAVLEPPWLLAPPLPPGFLVDDDEQAASATVSEQVNESRKHDVRVRRVFRDRSMRQSPC
jgi:hypothetical protein